MILSSLQIKTLRNLSGLNIKPGKRLNCLVGANGSGKTSILEAIYLLGLGRSFRAATLSRVIQHQANELMIFGELKDPESDFSQAKLGFSRDTQGKTRIKLNGDILPTMAELAQLCPILLLYAESYALFRDSPSSRRKWLDWGMFHVEPQFFPLWKKLQRVLQQRNVLLKQQAPNADIKVWDLQLVEIAEAIHHLRSNFIITWQNIMNPILQTLFNKEDLLLNYNPGWKLERGLAATLETNLTKDRAMGYTTSGPHRADIQIHINNTPAQHILSLGQQKLLVSGIILSQATLVQQLANKTPLLLIDDLPAELDEQARIKIAQIIHNINAQTFLTGIDLVTLEPFLKTPIPCTMFHVEHGQIRQ